jgi:flagellar hook-basal body complex protein FliE
MDPIQQAAVRNALEAAVTRNRQEPDIEKAGKSFGQLFENLLGGANAMGHEARTTVDGLLKGEVSDVHEVMVAVNKADLSFRFLVEVRNKLIDAYTELMRNSK